jgi:DNA-binding response OmpR family regulator
MKILIIDDNKDITDLFSKYFTLNNHECTTINDSSKAAQIVVGERFDRIILDLAMPGLTGYDVLNEISKQKNIEFLDVIVLTATDVSKEKEHELIKIGVKRILKKPISLSKIKELIVE